LREIFEKFGAVTSLMVRKDATGQSMGFGYVAFASHEPAAKAVEALDGKPHPLAIAEQNLFVKRFESKKERLKKREQAWRERQAQYAKYPNLYVKNLDDSVSEDKLKEAFEVYGPTQSVRIMYDKVTKISKGFGFVSYKDQAAAQKAINGLMSSTILGSRPLFVTFAVKRDARRAQYEEIQKKRAQRMQGMPGPMGGPMGGPPGGYQQPGLGNYGQMPMFPGVQGMPPQMRQPPLQQNPLALQQQLAMQRQAQMMMNPGMQQPVGMMPPQRIMRPQQPKPVMQPMQQQPQTLPTLLANMSIEQQKNVLGERIYNHIHKTHPAEAAKITGMLLEMDNSEILNLLEAPAQLDDKVREALEVLRQHTTGNY
jgi:polyadenylate-binding protein